VIDCPVKIIKSQRKKTASIEVFRDHIKVRVPVFFSELAIEQLLLQRRQWITKHQKALQNQPKVVDKQYIAGELFLYLGNRYTLEIVFAKQAAVMLRDKQLIVSIKPNMANKATTVQTQIYKWYREQARQYLQSRTLILAQKIGVSPKSVDVRTYKARWGCCRADGTVHYNWQLIAAPPDVIDYVIVHELCHLFEMNHSPKFWQHVNRHLPNWKQLRLWLKQNPIRI